MSDSVVSSLIPWPPEVATPLARRYSLRIGRDGVEYQLFFPGNKVAVAAHLRPSQSTSRPSGFGNP